MSEDVKAALATVANYLDNANRNTQDYTEVHRSGLRDVAETIAELSINDSPLVLALYAIARAIREYTEAAYPDHKSSFHD